MDTAIQNTPTAQSNSAPGASISRLGAGPSGLGRGLAPKQSSRQSSSGREFLTFRLGSEEYGIDILKVQEIRSYEPPTKIANAPSYLKGVVNLRGVIVPIIDLRVKFNCLNELGEAEINSFTVVIVL
ncbi:MAG TPA: chemotaxis protein CheW, partial [Aquabacterium sp.]|nr:chemotaxis protein CheW [Aquabacterium sp.]